MNIWIVYRRDDRRVMAMFQLLYEAANYVNENKQERKYIKRTDPANLEKGKDWFVMPKHLARPECGPFYAPTEAGEFRNA